MSRIIDISLGISPDMLTWPSDPPVAIHPTSRMSNGDHANVSSLTLGSHTGTHIDPPFHFIDGAPTVESLPLDALYGDAVVLDLRGVAEQIGPADFEAAGASGHRRLLCRTTNSELWRGGPVRFPDAYVSVSPDGARWLVDNGTMLVGVDFLSVEARGAPGHPTHVTLLEAGVVIVEGLRLLDVEPGSYTLACLPLKIVDGDGAPARAILIES